LSEIPSSSAFASPPLSISYSAPLPTACDLCGLPVGKSRAKLQIGGKTLRFCCPGCHGVYQILCNHPNGMAADFRETDLYRNCIEAGIIPRTHAEMDQRQTAEEETATSFSPSPLHLALRVEGMWCPACSWLIQAVLRKTKGVVAAKIHFLSDMAQIEYLPYVIGIEEILAKISHLGYHPSRFEEETKPAKAKRTLLLRLGISAILTSNIMAIAFAIYYGFFEPLSPREIRYLSWPLWIMATPVLFYGGWPIMKNGLTGVWYGAPSMETLIALGALSAYGYSFLQMVQGSLHLYFDTASMLVTLVLLGKFIEAQAREKTSAGIGELYRIANQKVRVKDPSFRASPFPPSGGERDGMGEKWIPVREAIPGTLFYVRAGERIPLDGRILQGEGNVDESILTGESRPLRKKPGDETMAGSLLLDGEMSLQITRVGKESSLGQTLTLLQEALSQKNSTEAVADQITRWFVPGILLIAILTGFLLWMNQNSLEECLLRGLTVLVISCPCALGIAAPIVKVAALNRGRNQGILIRDPSALKRARSLDTMVFDKTGTLTEGRYELQQLFTDQGSYEMALQQLAAIEIHSSHFLAKAIVRQAKDTGIEFQPSSSFKEWEGMGAKGLVEGKEIFIGNRDLMNRFHIEVSSRLRQEASSLESSARTVVFYGWEGKARGMAVFGDSLRRGIREMIGDLQSRKIETWLVSGDGENTTQAIAEEAGIPNHRGQALPQEKVQIIRGLQEKGHRVGMVGDGLNDAAALAQANVGFSLSAGAHLTRESSDVTFMASNPMRILQIIDLSILAQRVIRQNVFFAFFYNGLAIPLAISGLLNPLVAVLAMFASSLTVIGNALRISKIFPDSPPAPS
jgi:heavy metal translocating P-type ATPase